jgi:hypothetical protein
MKLDSYGSPEMALLMAASRGDPSAATVRRLMAGSINWPELTRLALESHATPGLWDVVSKFPHLPRESGPLQTFAVVNDYRRYHIRELTARVVRQLQDEGIEVLALKGAAMLAGGVTRPVQRTMADIDLLVTKGSPEVAWAKCQERGWTLMNESWNEEMYRDHHHLAPLVDPDGVKIGLELHRTLMPAMKRLGVDLDGILARARTVNVSSVPVRVPSVEDLLMHACLHFAWSNKLLRGAWRAYADVHSIVADSQFDWDRFLSVVTTRRAKQCCYWTFRLGQVITDLEVPSGVMRQLDPTEGGRFARLLERHFVFQIANPAGHELVAQKVRTRLWLAAMHEPSASAEADELWDEGNVEALAESSPQAPRGPLRAAFTTAGYLLRLASRG